METRVLSFFSQKGGCGKTSLAVITASYLRYSLKRSVLVIDGDSQASFYKKWLRECKPEKMDMLREGFPGLPEPYEVLHPSSLSEVPQLIGSSLNAGYEYIIVDLPGQLSDKDILKSVLMCDTIIVPLEHEPQALLSSLESSAVVSGKLMGIPGSRIRNLVAVFNRIPFTQRGRVGRLLPLLKEVKFTKVMRNMVGRVDSMSESRFCTVIPPDQDNLQKVGAGMNLGGFLNELCTEVLGL